MGAESDVRSEEALDSFVAKCNAVASRFDSLSQEQFYQMQTIRFTKRCILGLLGASLLGVSACSMRLSSTVHRVWRIRNPHRVNTLKIARYTCVCGIISSFVGLVLTDHASVAKKNHIAHLDSLSWEARVLRHRAMRLAETSSSGRAVVSNVAVNEEEGQRDTAVGESECRSSVVPGAMVRRGVDRFAKYMIPSAENSPSFLRGKVKPKVKSDGEMATEEAKAGAATRRERGRPVAADCRYKRCGTLLSQVANLAEIAEGGGAPNL